MITQVHVPALWEGGCSECTAIYRADVETYLMTAFYSGQMIDNWLIDEFDMTHEDH